MSAALTITVNGVERHVRTEPDTPLCYALRNEFGLCGTRFGCGQGYCGACTVLVDDRDRHSCEVTVGEVESRCITTVEGLLSTAGELGRVQQALVRHGAGQCGFCLSGIVMRIEAGLREGRHEKRFLVEKLDQNLCRCGIQHRVLRAIDDLLADLTA